MNHDNKGFRKLKVWNEAHKLTLLIYRLTDKFPQHELFGLTPQIRRAVVSIATNIVEGHVRNSKKEFLRHLDFANGSLIEVEYYIELAEDLGYITQSEYSTVENQRIISVICYMDLLKQLNRDA